MILIKTLFLNLIPEEVTVVEPEALVGAVVDLFYVFIFVYRTWIVAPAVLVEELSSSGISSEGGSRDAISVELSSSTASI